MQAHFFDAAEAAPWDGFCAGAHNATFLHTRRFLSYHGERFVDRSIVVEDNGRIVGLLPGALHPQDDTVFVSHPGASYGGMVHQGALRGAPMIEALQTAARLARRTGARKLHYKALPHIYHRSPAQDDLYALQRLGARRYRCDLSATIDLQSPLPRSERRRRALKKAEKAGLALARGSEFAGALWTVLEGNLARKHGVGPTHTVTEIRMLADRFPDQIDFVVARLQDEVVAGVVLFRCGPTVHAQYIAANDIGHEHNALDAVFASCIDRAASSARYFDFGISTEAQGTVLNEGLFRFKSEFGGAGVVHEFYELDLGEF
jgi:hypothetical protein